MLPLRAGLVAAGEEGEAEQEEVLQQFGTKEKSSCVGPVPSM
jgi:hypothetical protein